MRCKINAAGCPYHACMSDDCQRIEAQKNGADFQPACAEKILYLTLKKEWFNKVKSGEKLEEYREMKDYWFRRFRTGKKNAVCHASNCSICYYNHHPKCEWKR